MNIKDFNLLTQDEINEVVTEVLTELTPSQRAAAQNKARKIFPGSLPTPEEEAEKDKQFSAKAKADADKEMADVTGEPTGGQDRAAGAGDVPNAPVNQSLASKGTQTGTGGMANTQRGAADNTSGPGPDQDQKMQGAIDTERGRADGATQDMKGVQRVSDKTNPNDAFDDSDGRDEPGGVEGDMRINMTNTWFTPGSSNLQTKARQTVANIWQADLSIVQVLDAYLEYRYGGDAAAMSRENARNHWISRFKALVTRIDQQKDPETKQVAEMAVKRQLDSLLYMVAIFGMKAGDSKAEIKDTVEEPKPPPETPEEEEEDDTKFVTNQGMRTFFAKTTDLDNKQVIDLAAAVEADLGIVKEGRTPKEMPKTVEYILSLPTDDLKQSATRGVIDWLKSTEFALGRDSAIQLKQKHKPDEKPAEPEEEKPEEKPEEPKEGPKYMLPQQQNSAIIKLIRTAYEATKGRFPKEANFEDDFAEFINDLGRVKYEKAARVKPLEEISGGELGKLVAPKGRDNAKEAGRIRDALGALASNRRKNTGSYRIMLALRTNKKFQIKKRQYNTNAIAKALYKMWSSIKRAPKAQKDSGEPKDNVVNLDTNKSKTPAAAPSKPQKVAAENRLHENTINRWKTISGVGTKN